MKKLRLYYVSIHTDLKYFLGNMPKVKILKHCDICDKTLQSMYVYSKHMNNHMTRGIFLFVKNLTIVHLLSKYFCLNIHLNLNLSIKIK